MKMLRYIFTSVILLMSLAGCDIHEFPVQTQTKVPFELHLDFDTNLPLHTVVPYVRSGSAVMRSRCEDCDVRYLIKAYRVDNVVGENYTADTTVVVTKSDIDNLNHSVSIELDEGRYAFRVWCDYVKKGSCDDNYYLTSDFKEITLASRDEHPGSDEFRDAFRGIATAIVSETNRQTTVEMLRPMGRFEFISTDISEFAAQVKAEKGVQEIDWNTYRVVFCYEIFMPYSFNLFNDKTADSWRKVYFESRMTVENADAGEILLGFDYAFVDYPKTTLSVSVAVYDPNGVVVTMSVPIDVPIVRGKLTVVKGDFLTSKSASGSDGVAINPGYEGDDYNVEI